jgi:hypothetical protein
MVHVHHFGREDNQPVRSYAGGNLTVEPTDRGHVRPSKTNRPSDAAAGKQLDAKTKQAPRIPNTDIDRVEVSSAAQELQELTGSERINTNTLPAQRIQEILKRVSDGFYDKPEVIEETARRVAEDIGEKS